LETDPNIKKLTIRLRILYNDVLDYNQGSFFGVQAMDTEVLHLWVEYSSLLSEFDTAFPLIFKNFKDLPYPDPYIAGTDSFYKEGTMIYKPEHFASLRLAIEKMLETVGKINIEGPSQESKSQQNKNCA